VDCCGERRGGTKESTNSYIAKIPTQYPKKWSGNGYLPIPNYPSKLSTEKYSIPNYPTKNGVGTHTYHGSCWCVS